ncbi:MAG: NADP oxidoreductase, partial [Actinomycetota bacterium]|nr:NADP oxidoreductase [Actinomycetota bacterium]
IGSRTADNEAAAAWSAAHGAAASTGTFAEAASFGGLAFNCTAGAGALAAVSSAQAALETSC